VRRLSAQRGRAFGTSTDVFGVVALVALVLVVVVPQVRVKRLLTYEDEVIADLVDLERREEDHRAKGATDRDQNGKGEYASLGVVLGSRNGQFERVDDRDVWRRGGYFFTVLLPDREKKAVPATSPGVHAPYAEVAELLVAWPAEPGRTGMRAYARWPGGQLLQHAIDGFPYGDDPPIPDDPLIAIEGGKPKPAPKYDREDWRVPVMTAPVKKK
jgi:hypothetical protein